MMRRKNPKQLKRELESFKSKLRQTEASIVEINNALTDKSVIKNPELNFLINELINKRTGFENDFTNFQKKIKDIESQLSLYEKNKPMDGEDLNANFKTLQI